MLINLQIFLLHFIQSSGQRLFSLNFFVVKLDVAIYKIWVKFIYSFFSFVTNVALYGV